jgi:putative redox protein
MPDITVQLDQTGVSTSVAAIRDHQVTIDRPQSKGGTDAGPMGGELFLASIGGCFMSNLLAALNARDAAVSSVHTAVTGTLEGTPQRFTTISIRVSAEYADNALMQKLVDIADKGCIMTNTLRATVPVKISIV